MHNAAVSCELHVFKSLEVNIFGLEELVSLHLIYSRL